MKRYIGLCLLAVLLAVACVPVCADTVEVTDGAVFVAFGASNTALSSWPSDVAGALNMRLYNAGIGGNNTSHGIARLERDVLSYNPDFVTICFGTNDFNRQGSGKPQVTPEDYRKNLITMITEIQKIDAVPILVTSPIIQEYPCGGPELYPEGSVNAGLDVYVNIVRELADEYDVPLVDVHAIMDETYTADEVLVSDGVHLTELGNKVFTDALCAYFNANYGRDYDVPPVEYPKAPEAQEPPFTASLIPFDDDGWREIYPDTINMKVEKDGAISFANKTGLWPEAHYSPTLDKALTVPVRGSYLTVDIELQAAMNIILYLNGANPTWGYDSDYIPLNPLLKAAIPSLNMLGDDITGGQRIKCTLNLADFLPDSMISEDGTVVFSGVKLYVVGEAGKKIKINELSVTAPDPATLPSEPVYDHAVRLMPETERDIGLAQGAVDTTFHEDGTFTLARAAESDIAWPSVRIEVGKEVDLSQTPLLYLRVNMNKGCANGYLYYTSASGKSGSVHLSDLVYGTVNDFTTDVKTYVDLAAYLGIEEVITVDYLTLSVYGNVGDAITWKEIAAARLVEESKPPVTEPSDDLSDEPSVEPSDEPSQAESYVPSEPEIDDSKGIVWIVLIAVVLIGVAFAVIVGMFKKKS